MKDVRANIVSLYERMVSVQDVGGDSTRYFSISTKVYNTCALSFFVHTHTPLNFFWLKGIVSALTETTCPPPSATRKCYLFLG